MFVITDAWKRQYSNAHTGFLIMRQVYNPNANPDLEKYKEGLQNRLRKQHAGKNRSDIEAIPTIQAYKTYYKQFDKTYHVLGQLESVALKSRTIPSVAGLVEAMFIAELKNLLLTAGHDIDCLQLPVSVDAARGDERYTTLRGQEQTCKAGDMLMSDRTGVISSIVYGPDQRTQIKPETRSVLFAVYAPAGIPSDAVSEHLQDIANFVRLVSPASKVEVLHVYDGG